MRQLSSGDLPWEVKNGVSSHHPTATHAYLLVQLNVDHVQDIDWIPDVLDRLVLESDEKAMITALLHYSSDVPRFDDFIPGKGKIATPVAAGTQLT